MDTSFKEGIKYSITGRVILVVLSGLYYAESPKLSSTFLPAGIKAGIPYT
jgi:hypothetical protein